MLAAYEAATEAIDKIAYGKEPVGDRLAKLRGLVLRNLVPADFPLNHRQGGQSSLVRFLDGWIQELAKEYHLGEKTAWIKAHGSDHLRRATATGADCQRLYATERAALEAPDWNLDFDDNTEWKSRSCPSMAALDLLDEANTLGLGKAQIVWLVIDVDECQPMSNEAIALIDYLDKYTLVKIV